MLRFNEHGPNPHCSVPGQLPSGLALRIEHSKPPVRSRSRELPTFPVPPGGAACLSNHLPLSGPEIILRRMIVMLNVEADDHKWMRRAGL
jgi:hypothetical protein